MKDGPPQSWDDRNIWRAGLIARTMWLLVFIAVFTLVPMLGDRWAYDNLHNPRIYELDWGRLLRQMGWWPTWIVGSLALWLTQRGANAALARWNALYLLVAPAVAGIVCEILKLSIRRVRPEINDGDYGFRPWSDEPFSTAGLATPSSHTMVAFGAATALARIFPGAQWLWYALAAGCAVTRILAHAHFLSDTTLGALLGWSVGWGVWIAMKKSRPAS